MVGAPKGGIRSREVLAQYEQLAIGLEHAIERVRIVGLGHEGAHVEERLLPGVTGPTASSSKGRHQAAPGSEVAGSPRAPKSWRARYWLWALHRTVRLSTVLGPPRAKGTMWSSSIR